MSRRRSRLRFRALDRSGCGWRWMPIRSWSRASCSADAAERRRTTSLRITPPACGIECNSRRTDTGRIWKRSNRPWRPDRLRDVGQTLRQRSRRRAALLASGVPRCHPDRRHRQSRSRPHQHVVCGASELDSSHDHAPLYAAVQRVFSQGREPHAAGVTTRLFDVMDLVNLLIESERDKAAQLLESARLNPALLPCS